MELWENTSILLTGNDEYADFAEFKEKIVRQESAKLESHENYGAHAVYTLESDNVETKTRDSTVHFWGSSAYNTCSNCNILISLGCI